MEMVGGARRPLSPAVQRTVAAIIIRLASRAQYSKVVQLLTQHRPHAVYSLATCRVHHLELDVLRSLCCLA